MNTLQSGWTKFKKIIDDSVVEVSEEDMRRLKNVYYTGASEILIALANAKSCDAVLHMCTTFVEEYEMYLDEEDKCAPVPVVVIKMKI